MAGREEEVENRWIRKDIKPVRRLYNSISLFISSFVGLGREIGVSGREGKGRGKRERERRGREEVIKQENKHISGL